MDELPIFIERLALYKNQKFKAAKIDQYMMIFEKTAADLGDDGIPFHAANKVLGRRSSKRWRGSGKEDEIFGYHPLDRVHSPILTTTFANREEVAKIYDSLHERGSKGNI